MKADALMYLGREALSKECHFLLTGEVPKEIESRKKYAFIKKASKYIMLNDVLFMKGAYMIPQRVPWKEEIYRILEDNHEEHVAGILH